MSDSQKAIDRINTLLQRTTERGASEAEENTAARMVCKLLRQFPGILQPVPTLHDIEQQRHRAAAGATQQPFWRPSGFNNNPNGGNNNTASGTGDIDEMREWVSGFNRFAAKGYVAVRYNKFIRQNDTEILLLVETKDGWEEVWLPLDKITMRTRMVWIDEAVAKEKNLRYR